MTTRNSILDIMEDSSNREELLLRLVDLVECERDRFYEQGQKAGRIGAQHDKLVKRLTGVL